MTGAAAPPRRSRRAPVRLGALAAGVAVALLVAYPRSTGLTGLWPITQLVAFRAVLAIGLVGLAALLLVLPGRRHRLAVVGVVALAAALQVGVLADRGLGGAPPPDDASAADGDLVVLAANTHATASAADLADLVGTSGADVVVLPETTRAVADDVAARLATSGRPMQVLARQTGSSPISATALLVGARLGTYRIDRAAPQVIATFIAVPVDGDGPTLVAVHTTAPSGRRSMAPWRASTAWATAACRELDGAVVAGDFNATLDHPAFARLSPCVDAAEDAGAAGLGSWPSSAPRWLAAPIDHVLVDGASWRVRSFTVLDAPPGCDHRPVVAHLAAR